MEEARAQVKPVPLEIQELVIDGLSVHVTYVTGGKAHVGKQELLFQVVGEADFGKPEKVVIGGQDIGEFANGQTINVKIRASNRMGMAESEAKSITV